MELRLSAAARVKLLGIVNNWPATNRGMLKMLDRLAEALDLSEEDRAAVNWQPVVRDGQTFYTFQGATMLASEMPDEDVHLLRHMIEPSDHAQYTRREAAILAEIEAALGELT